MTVAAGAGLADVEAGEAQPFIATGRLVPVLTDWTKPFEGLALYYPRQRLLTATFRAFIDFYMFYSQAIKQAQVSWNGGHLDGLDRKEAARSRLLLFRRDRRTGPS